ATQDLDVTLLTGFGDEGRYVDALLASLSPRIADARSFALRHRVLLLSDAHGTPVDVALGAMPFEERAIERAVPFATESTKSITVCSASDLVIHKAFAARDQDWLDVRNILVRSGSILNWDLVLEELTPLVELKQEPEILSRLNALRAEVAL